MISSKTADRLISSYCPGTSSRRNLLQSNEMIVLTASVSAEVVNTSVLQGDEVVTSGLGGIFPKGILIGTISEVVNTKNELDRYAVVTPATDFSKLETVLVITNQ